MNWFKSAGKVRLLAVVAKGPDRSHLAAVGAHANWHLEFADSVESAVVLAKEAPHSAIIFDRDLPGVAWQDAIAKLSAEAPDSRVILMSPVNSDLLWQDVIQRGGYDVLLKPVEEAKLARIMSFASSMR